MEKESISTFSIHGFPWALRYLLIVFSKMVCLLFNCGFEKVSLKILVRLLYLSSRVFEKFALKAFENVLVKSII